MAIYWHPLLAQFLRQALGDCIRIDDSIPLGEMPLEMDLLFHPTVPIESLPYPFNHLGPQTLGELKGADDSADGAALAQIESYAPQAGSRFARDLFVSEAAEDCPSRGNHPLGHRQSVFRQFFCLYPRVDPDGGWGSTGDARRIPHLRD